MLVSFAFRAKTKHLLQSQGYREAGSCFLLMMERRGKWNHVSSEFYAALTSAWSPRGSPSMASLLINWQGQAPKHLGKVDKLPPTDRGQSQGFSWPGCYFETQQQGRSWPCTRASAKGPQQGLAIPRCSVLQSKSHHRRPCFLCPTCVFLSEHRH